MLITIGIIMPVRFGFFPFCYIRGYALSFFLFLFSFSLRSWLAPPGDLFFFPFFFSCLHIFPEGLSFLVAFCFCLVSTFAETGLATTCGSPFGCFLYCLFSWIDTLLKNLGSDFSGEDGRLDCLWVFTKLDYLAAADLTAWTSGAQCGRKWIGILPTILT